MGSSLKADQESRLNLQSKEETVMAKPKQVRHYSKGTLKKRAKALARRLERWTARKERFETRAQRVEQKIAQGQARMREMGRAAKKAA